MPPVSFATVSAAAELASDAVAELRDRLLQYCGHELDQFTLTQVIQSKSFWFPI